MSAVTYGELIFGVVRSSRVVQGLAALSNITNLVPVLPLPEQAGEQYGRLRFDLERRGEIIGSNDLWIAAHALASGLTLVTNNEREFRRVRGLKIENWTK